MTANVYESTVEYNEDFGEYYLTIPDELLEHVGWEEGDVLEWHMNKDGTVLLERVDEFFDGEENE
jgi:bifunctional DNA-binding transcriptional regulator/antitoxin component of YhaV-PrlF toxin-antitoxin module